MIYSVFVPEQGLYHYYETPENKPVNGDLPVPKLGQDAGKIGVAAMDAGRPLPSNARKVGQGWTARGVIASQGFGVLGLPTFNASGPIAAIVPWIPVAGAGALAYAATKKQSAAVRVGSAVAAAAVVFGAEMAYLFRSGWGSRK